MAGAGFEAVSSDAAETRKFMEEKMHRNFYRILKKLLYFILAGVILSGSAAWAAEKYYYDWTAPPEIASMKNPYSGNPGVRKEGGAVYQKWCLRCHGRKGDGDGSSSLSLRIPPGDFTDKKRMNAQTDGTLFWKVRVGRGEMPPWQLILRKEEIWKAIGFIRKFSK